jgi:ABC-type nitrate/sulfonate/bicarbonate transport system permease component
MSVIYVVILETVCHEDDGLGGHLHNYRYKLYIEMVIYMRVYSEYFRLML